jgi:DNA-binding response OmpR family regulator
VTRILIAEDDPLVSAFIDKGLRAQGWSTVVVADGEQAEQLGLSGDFDMVILDIGLPQRDGLHVLRAVRSKGVRSAVLILTGQPQVRDVTVCLDSGADDYMTKPFRFEELLARVRARLRPTGDDQPHVLGAGLVRLDLWAREAIVGERTVPLTSREFMLLETFLRHPGQVLSRQQLLSSIWGYSFDPGSNLVNVYVSGLRKKLGENVIETVRGAGYRFRAQ